MDHGLLHDIKQHPKALGLSIALHLVVVVILTVSLSNTSVPKLPNVAKVKTVQAVIVDARVVDVELEKLKAAEQNKRNKEDARKDRLQKEAQKAKQDRRKEENRLADIKRKQKQREKEDKAKQAKLDNDRKAKQQELAELEKKQQLEQQKLAAIESKRKAEEDELRKKQQAKEDEIRRQQDLAELRRQMEEDEREQMKLNSHLQILRAQYVKLIEQKIERNWSPPANMIKGWSCVVNVQQNVLGDVTDVRMLNCSGSDAFKDTVERAVRKASPLPSPADPKVFESKIQITFKPDV